MKFICANSEGGYKGVALIITMLILLALVLLGLALMLQTDTEQLIAVNERDSLETFHYAEAGMAWTKRKVLDIADASGFTNFSDLLNGPNNGSAADDYTISLRTIDPSLTLTSQLDTTNEQTTSLVVQKDFGEGSKSYEVFRWGINEDGDAEWEGPRALIYVRIDDNYDDTGSNNPLVDTDQIVIANVVSEYPIFVDSSGVESPGTRTVARRHLKARFGSATLQPAIITRRSLQIQGNADVCGECGSVHANQTIFGGGDIKTCQDLTWVTANGSDFLCPSEQSGPVVGDECGAGFDEIEVPIINPYDEVMVPTPSDFNGSAFSCDSTTPKYYAFVANNNKGLIFKAFWVSSGRPDTTAGGGGWKWKLIDDLNDSSNTMLDDCGRVVCGTVGGVSVHEVGDGVCAAGENWLNDDKDDEFYGFKQSDPITSFTNCSGDATLDEASDINDNDFNTANFYCSTPNTFCGTDNTIYSANFRLLPGGFDPDGTRDFADSRFEDGKARWTFSSNLMYSSTFNAVIWVYGRLDMSGNPGDATAKVCTAATSGVQNKKCEESGSPLLSTLGGFWRVSFIAVGSIVISGNPKYSTARPDFPFLLISGRDIMISGNPGSGETKCNPGAGVCGVNVGNSAEFAGIIAAHEQVKMNGNFSSDGFIVIEDAVDCTTDIAKRESGTGQPLDWSGNPNVHYDCVNPPNPWGGSIKITSWQELQ